MKKLLLIGAMCLLMGCTPTRKQTKETTGTFMRETMDAMTEYKIVIQHNVIKQRTEIHLEKR